MKIKIHKLIIGFTIAIILFTLIRLPLGILNLICYIFGLLDKKIEDIFTYRLNPIGTKLVRWMRQ